MRDVRLRTLGSFDVRIDGVALARPSTQKARALLAYLAMHQGTSIAREVLIETFWPQAEPDNARASLKTALWSIRRVARDGGIDPDTLFAADVATVRWHAQTHVDALEFEQRARAGDGDALALYTGDFLPGDYDDWTSAQRERLTYQLETLLQRSLEGTRGIDAAERLLQLDPFNEAAYITLIEAERRANRLVAAQTLAERFRRVLAESGLAPSVQFEERFATLRAVRSDVRERFIGRANELAHFDERLSSDDALRAVVHADAGFGKTALLTRFAERAVKAGRTVVLVQSRAQAVGFGDWEHVYAHYGPGSLATLLEQRGAGAAAALAHDILAALPSGALVIVDDAHNLVGDAEYVASTVAGEAATFGIGIIVATRPEGLSRVWSWFAQSTATEFALGALSEEEIRSAIGSSAGNVRALYERTGGHPLFLQRLLERSESGEPNLAMPASVRELIKARLRERGDDAYAAATALAIDLNFTGEELAQLLGWTEERALDAFDDLFALGIVREGAEAPHLRFTHDVMMEVARESLGPHRRRKLHRLAAELLADERSIAGLSRRAEHISAIGDHAAAARALYRSGKASLDAFEPRNAAVSFDRALVALRHLDRSPQTDRFTLEISVAMLRALNASCQAERCLQFARAAAALAAHLHDRALLLDVARERLRTNMRILAVDDIARNADEVAQLALELGDRAAYAEGAFGRGVHARVHARTDDSIHAFRDAYAAAMDAGEADFALSLLGEIVHAQLLAWWFPDALATAGEGMALYGRGLSSEPSFRYNVAQLYYLLERPAEGLAELDAARTFVVADRFRPGRFGHHRDHLLAIIDNMTAILASKVRDWDRALRAAQAFEASLAAESPMMRVHVAELLTNVLLERARDGDFERARTLFERIDPASIPEQVVLNYACTQARIFARAVRLGSGSRDAARTAIEGALERARAAVCEQPTDADSIFDTLVRAAADCGERDLEDVAARERDLWLERRVLAAGAAWGGPLAQGSR